MTLSIRTRAPNYFAPPPRRGLLRAGHGDDTFEHVEDIYIYMHPISHDLAQTRLKNEPDGSRTVLRRRARVHKRTTAYTVHGRIASLVVVGPATHAVVRTVRAPRDVLARNIYVKRHTRKNDVYIVLR